MSEINNENYLEKLFIGDVKSLIQRWSCDPGGPDAYSVSNIDELPGNAFDGSIGIVNVENTAGTWLLNDTISLPTYEMKALIRLFDSSMIFRKVGASDAGELIYINDNDGEDYREVCTVWNDGWVDEKYRKIEINNSDDNRDPNFITWLKANAVMVDTRIEGYWRFKDEIDFEGIDYYINFIAYDERIGQAAFSNLYDDSGNFAYESDFTYRTAIDNGNWSNPQYRTICIYTPVEDAEFIDWLKANATKITPSKLYTFENGEWVYKCEIV